jgi:histidinol phosphatase-like enzyme (inositol monophosphatase family)
MPNPSPQDLLKAALEISEAAASIPMRYFRSDIAVEDKADESPVTIADRQTEEHIRRAILERFPSHGIFGEEFGRTDTESGTTWIVDPIDGTKSFISGMPLFGMLLGVMRDGRAEAGVIRMPALGEVFAGCRGGQATWNGEPMRCRPSPPLADARVFINEAERILSHDSALLGRIRGAGRFMRFANDCYAFGLLAAGQIDVVVDFDLQPYDYLPVVPVVEAAGGVMTDWRGQPLGLESDGSVIAAGSAKLHAALIDLVNP